MKARLQLGALARIALTTAAGGFLCAAMVRYSPGFGVDEKQLDARLSAASQQAALHAHDRERSPLAFYVSWWKHAARGDFGFSRSLNRPIGELIRDRAPDSIRLMARGVAGAWLLAILLAVPAATWRLRSVALVGSAVSGAAAALPAAGIAILLFRIGSPAGWMIALVLFPRLYQYLRNLLADAFAAPHVLFARAKGLGWARVLATHVLGPSRAQLLALAAVSLNMAFGAAVAVEAICDIPGLGQLAWKAAAARDLPVLVVLTVGIALATQAANLAADLCSPAPRRES